MYIIIGVALLAAIGLYVSQNYISNYNGAVLISGTGKKRGEVRYVEKTSTESEKKIGLSFFVTIAVVTFLLRVIVAMVYKGYEVDMNCFLAWADMVYENGFSEFYNLEAFTDYPPGYMYVLFLIGAIRDVFGIGQTSALSILLTKLPAICMDMATGWLIFKIASKRLKATGAALVSGIYLITPAVFYDSVIWGQVDSVYTFFVLMMCYLITEKKLIPSYFVFAIGILVKPQVMMFGPILIFGIIDQIFLDSLKKDERNVFWKKFFVNLGMGILAIACICLLMLPFGFFDALKQYTETLGSYPYASVNAYNFWTMIGKNWASQTNTLFGLEYRTWGTIAIVAAVVAAAFIHFKTKDKETKYYFTAAFLIFVIFTFSVRMHERYAYAAFALLLVCYALRLRRKIMFGYIFTSTVVFLNMAHSMFYYDPQNFSAKAAFPIFVGALTVAACGYMIYLAVTGYIQYESEEREAADVLTEKQKAERINKKKTTAAKDIIRPSKTPVKMGKQDFIIMGVITLVYAVIAFSNLGNTDAPDSKYEMKPGDEIRLDFGEEVSITKIWNYLGHLNNPKFVVSYSSDGETDWVDAFSEANPWDAGSVFNWNETETEITGRYVRIAPLATTVRASIMELVFIDADGKMITPKNVSEYRTLFDEQYLFEGRDSNLNGTYFDEIYHARTAYEMIEGVYCYENTHPPLGKIIMSIGILIFGMNPFGWRFMGTLFGVLMLPALYVFAKKMFKETWISTLTTILFTFDFMHFVQTRIATIDVFVTLFIILAYLGMFCYMQKSFYDTRLRDTFLPLGLCGIAMGFSWACKWTGFYASAGLCILFFYTMAQRFREYIYAAKNPAETTNGISHRHIIKSFHPNFFKTIGFCCIFFVLIPAVIYILSYIPFEDGSDRGLIARMLHNQETMFTYHSGLDATHDFSSMWYEWPIMTRPIWFYAGEVNGLEEGISSFGNPVVWWLGIPAFFMVLYLAVVGRDRKGGFLTIGYLSQFLPWFFVTRVVFIYHYFPSVPFVVLMLGYCMKKITDSKPKWKPVMYGVTALAIALFILFYPVLAGSPVSVDYVDSYLRWFDSWVLI